MGGIQKRCAAGRIHDTITKNLYTSEKQNKIIYTKKNPSDPSSGFFLWFCKKVPKKHNKNHKKTNKSNKVLTKAQALKLENQ